MESQESAVTRHPTSQDLEAERIEKLRSEFLGGISWFYWIGALSLVNIGMILLADRRFIIGLGITDILSYLGAGEGIGGISPAWVGASVVVSLLFIWLGFQGRKGKQGYILGGLAFYALDAGLLALGQDWLSVLFHAYAGFMIFKGFRALKQILAASRAAAGEATVADAQAPASLARKESASA